MKSKKRSNADECFAAGMAIAGAGAGINELTALAVTSELAPTRKRGTYVAVLVFTILPFTPSVLWAQLIAAHAGWRYCGAFCGAWAAAGLLMTICFYFPPPRVNSSGLTRMEVIKQVDYVGGLLSISGMLVFMAALQWGGYQVCRTVIQQVREGPSLRLVSVLVEIRPHTRPLVRRILPPRGIRHLGSQVRQVSHVSSTSEAESQDFGPDTSHYVHFGRQFLFSPALLAHSSVQRIRS